MIYIPFTVGCTLYYFAINKCQIYFCRLLWKQKYNLFFVTDLSAAGSPAELKHITQRRKRKQPWFPQWAASEEGPNSTPNRASYGLELWRTISCLVWDWRNSMCKANPLLNTTLHVSIEPKKVTAHWAKNPSISLGGIKRVALLGSEASSGRYVSAKVKYRVGRPISNK